MKSIAIFAFFFSSSILFSQLRYEVAFPGLSFDAPVDIQSSPDESNRIFIVEQEGRIKVFENLPGVNSVAEFLDLTDKVLYGGEQGLLGLAFHPEFSINGYFYIDYTTDNPRRTVISRFKVKLNNPNEADPESESVLLEIDQPYSNHNGGQIAFGPDGYLYISMGDGGSGGDPENRAQNLSSLLGKILRIDVDNSSDGEKYAIPTDNPFAGNTNNYMQEIFAYGLRNVWRFSFDHFTGELWAADVGQDVWEEIDIIKNGKNYGWRMMEGFHCYNPSSDCEQPGLELPVWEYEHNSSGGYSITGGYLYRGAAASEIYDKYIYGDFVSGRIWALAKDGTNYINELLFETNRAISTFGNDRYNNLYFADYNSGNIYIIKGTLIVSAESIKPNKYFLHQNYPNPANPTTTIKFSLEKYGHVKIILYDSLGRQVGIIFNGYANAGINTVSFDASKLASGIYIYKLISENFTFSRKMVVLK
ncbi:MAG: PQQ-dependent sugar dehydrogenase [bacterium]